MEKIKYEEEFQKALETIGVNGELPEDTSFEKMGIDSGSEVSAEVGGALNFTLCYSTKLHYATGITSHRHQPILH